MRLLDGEESATVRATLRAMWTAKGAAVYGLYAPLMARQLDYQAEADVKQREAVWALVKGLAPAVQKEHHAAFVQRLKVEEAVSVLKVAVETWTGLPDATVRGYYAEQVLRRQLWGGVFTPFLPHHRIVCLCFAGPSTPSSARGYSSTYCLASACSGMEI